MAQSLIQIQYILEQHDFDFPHLPERLKCVICHKILKSAKQTSCGCKVCDKCINNYLFYGPKPCPSKQADCAGVILNLKDDINQDNATNKEICNLKVKCPFTSCKYENQLKNMEAHIVNCELREISCDKCGEKFLAKDKANHDRSMCNMRNVICQLCGQNMTAKSFYEHHINITDRELCTKLKGTCLCHYSVTGEVNIKKHLINCLCRLLRVRKDYYEIVNSKTFIWTIRNLCKQIEDGKQSGRIYLRSPPYFTSKHGYKFELKVNLVGVNEEYESHVTVQLVFMKNEYDSFLSWPFGQRVLLSIIDEYNNYKYITDLGGPFNRFDGFFRPSAENEMYGPEKLIPLFKIIDNGDQHGDRILYFKVSVDMDGISKP